MGRFIDLVGQRFGRLVVEERVENGKDGHARFLCVCDCGNKIIAYGHCLRSGVTPSCGCLKREKVSKARTTHGKSKTRLYNVWFGMKKRCADIEDKNYGGRGIKVCEEWINNYQAFHDWAMANGYDENAGLMECTLDRIDVNGNYEPNNCRWVNAERQANNTRVNAYITYNGETHSLKDWCRKLNLPYWAVQSRRLEHPEYSPEELFVPSKWDAHEVLVTYLGKTQNLSQWARELNLKTNTVCGRYWKAQQKGIELSPEELFKKDNGRFVYVEYKGERHNLTEWCNILGLDRVAILSRHRKHPEYTPEQLFAPVKSRKSKL